MTLMEKGKPLWVDHFKGAHPTTKGKPMPCSNWNPVEMLRCFEGWEFQKKLKALGASSGRGVVGVGLFEGKPCRRPPFSGRGAHFETNRYAWLTHKRFVQQPPSSEDPPRMLANLGPQGSDFEDGEEQMPSLAHMPFLC